MHEFAEHAVESFQVQRLGEIAIRTRLHAVHQGHLDIQQDEVRSALLPDLDGFPTIHGEDHLVAIRGENCLQQQSIGGLVPGQEGEVYVIDKGVSIACGACDSVWPVAVIRGEKTA